jgi:hypothetical protein
MSKVNRALVSLRTMPAGTTQRANNVEEALQLTMERLQVMPANHSITLPFPMKLDPPKQMAGFLCPNCSYSVWKKELTIPNTRLADVFTCHCISVWIPRPHEEINQGDWQGLICRLIAGGNATIFHHQLTRNQ